MQYTSSSRCAVAPASTEFFSWPSVRAAAAQSRPLPRKLTALSGQYLVSTDVAQQRRLLNAGEVICRARAEAATATTKERKASSLQVEKDGVGSFSDPLRTQPGQGPAGSSLDVAPAENGKPKSVVDYLESCPDLIKPDGGPPRWFAPLAPGPPRANAPLLLFLPGMDGTGYGLVVHQQALQRIFEVQCLHIPVMDRTPLEGLLNLVEETVTSESKVRSQPIYIVGDSFGGPLALAVAARNPNLDLIVIVANPATSFERSQLQMFLPLLEVAPPDALSVLPYLLSFSIGDPIRMALGKIDQRASPLEYSQQLPATLLELLSLLPTLSKVVPKETLLWKLKLLRSAARYANSRLHAITAQVLVLASGRDQLLPSVDESSRLEKVIPNCVVRKFPDSGHTLLLEGGLNLATLIKKSSLYRVSRGKMDYVGNYTPPTLDEVIMEYNRSARLLRQLLSPVYLSTAEDGNIVRGLPTIPKGRIVIYVGNHSLLGVDMGLFIGEFALMRGEILRGLGHPMLFNKQRSNADQYVEAVIPTFDQARLLGAAPVSGMTLYKFLQSGSSVLLYPGGNREATHRKGEAHKLFWPEQPEFVRMAAKFGAIIVPFGVVGEDDTLELVMDLNDMNSIPYLKAQIDNYQTMLPQARINATGELDEVGAAAVHLPIAVPKVLPGRLYTLFSKPIDTKDMPELLTDRQLAKSLYKETKDQVQTALEYLLQKRNQDPYRGVIPRLLYETTWGRQAPTFDSL